MTTETKSIQHILFTRVWRSLEQAAILSVRTHHDAGAAFTQLCHAVNQWVATTKEGKQLAVYSAQDLNIGDLLSHDAFQDANLLTLMEAAGVEYVACYGLSDVQCQDYDRVLMDRMTEIEANVVPVVTEASAAPIRLTGDFGQWVPEATFYRKGENVVATLAARFPELPATHMLKTGDPRSYLAAMIDFSYLAAYQSNEVLGVMLEVPVASAPEISGDDFAALVAEQQKRLQTLQDEYASFTFSVAHGAATTDGCLCMRAFVPLDDTHDLAACDADDVLSVTDELILGALKSTLPSQVTAA